MSRVEKIPTLVSVKEAELRPAEKSVGGSRATVTDVVLGVLVIAYESGLVTPGAS